MVFRGETKTFRRLILNKRRKEENKRKKKEVAKLSEVGGLTEKNDQIRFRRLMTLNRNH